MKNLLICIVAVLFIFIPLLSSCTKSEDAEKEKGAIDRMTEKVGKEMADSITDPLEKARNAKELSEEYNRNMEENIKKE
jgi:hypothetical protein